ncbi:MAG: hypothetical protein AAB483_02395 [Patescibacteria group bacterium]
MQNPETRQCQNCQASFTITPDDFGFYEKIAVPAPTFCPECRFQRRLSWRNERTLHRTICAATKKPIISGFAPDSGYVVYDRDYWWSDAWDPLSFGLEYDSAKSFFQQYDELMRRVPHPAVFNARTTNCDYTQYTGEFKDGYLVSASWEGENVAYGARVQSVKDSLDLYILVDGSLCYDVVSCFKMYSSMFSEKSENCTNCQFVYACKGCNDCFGCTNLRNKSYHIFNQPYSKEEYKKKLEEMDLGSFKNLEAARKKFTELKLAAIRKYANLINAPECTGDDLTNSVNCKSCFVATNDMRNCKYVANSTEAKDSYDGYGIGAAAEMMYEAFDSGVQASRLCFVATVYGGVNIFYSYNCHGCQNLFGCVGLRGKQYCIFNKQYTKEEFESLRAKIVEQMTRAGEYGEFFPTAISPFGYNETVANDYLPLTKEQATTKGYKWRDREASEHQPTVKAENLPDHIKDIDDNILKEIIECASCHRIYRIIKRELDFLKRFNIALPRKCFECRHQDRFHQVNFPRLHHRQCMCKTGHAHSDQPCPNEFETTYAPARPETIYCEQCYNAEVV